jgi:DNA-binding CsgD family transcriptional regulator
VLRAYSDGARGYEGVSRVLGIKVTTVATHAKNVRAKLSAETNEHAMAIAFRTKILI